MLILQVLYMTLPLATAKSGPPCRKSQAIDDWAIRKPFHRPQSWTLQGEFSVSLWERSESCRSRSRCLATLLLGISSLFLIAKLMAISRQWDSMLFAVNRFHCETKKKGSKKKERKREFKREQNCGREKLWYKGVRGELRGIYRRVMTVFRDLGLLITLEGEPTRNSRGINRGRK